ncbi:MAG: LacI family DNA-binding transcriptional regulator [Lachnospiraceae bacterium]|nr:LacI family DNA-binding transcriptional regulator [Lachnospiraceae bacterium]
MVSVKDIAAACKVSVATVSKALNGYPDISETTRESIKAKARELGYMPNLAAVTLKTNRTYNLGVLFFDEAKTGFTQEFFARILENVKEEAEKKGYAITFINNRIGKREVTYTEHCKYRGFDGVVIACVHYDDPEVIELVRSDIPVVTIDHVFHEAISITSDNFKGISDLVQYAYDCGHRRIAFIHGAPSTVTNDRMTGFYRKVEELGLDIPDEYVKECEYRDTEKAGKLTKHMLKLKIPPTCILYPDDYTATGGINAIKSMGLTIPDDISVIGYDGTSYSELAEPRLTTLKQDTVNMGKLAAKKLIELIEKPKTTMKEHMVVEGFVSIGKSVKML